MESGLRSSCDANRSRKMAKARVGVGGPNPIWLEEAVTPCIRCGLPRRLFRVTGGGLQMVLTACLSAWITLSAEGVLGEPASSHPQL